MKPFLKWAGGKFRLLDTLKQHFPSGKRFVEPFLGSGAVSLNVEYNTILANDVNEALVGTWQCIKERQLEFIADVQRMFVPENNTLETYNALRQEFNEEDDECRRAILFIYLNRHGFNGFCRFNRDGKFNVPFGKYSHPYFPEKELLHALEVSKRMQIMQGNFQTVLSACGEGDVVYLDPPYVPLSPTASFTSYAGNEFGMVQQTSLVNFTLSAAERGATIIVSNHDTPITRELYKDADEIHALQVQRNILCRGDKRGKAPELIAVYKP